MADPIIDFVKEVCVQDAILWSRSGPDGYGNSNYSISAVKVRWDQKQKAMIDKDNVTTVSNAEILVDPDVEVNVRDWIALGVLSESTSSDPTAFAGAYEIMQKDRSPLFQSTTEFVQTVYV